MKRFGILQMASPSPVWRLYYLAGLRHGLEVVFFSSGDVDFRRKRMYGWSSGLRNGAFCWKRRWLPFPDVVYENYPAGSKSRIGAKIIKRRLADMGIPVFNPSFYNKIRLDFILRKSKAARKFLPPTKAVRSAADVCGFLDKYSHVFLKPSGGFQGQGICQIVKFPGRQVRVKSDKFVQNRPYYKVFARRDFISFINRRLKKQNYIVQKGLSLVKKGNRKIDFRVVIHRDSQGNWRSAGIVPKIGKAGAIVTNHHAGGTKTTWRSIADWAEQTGQPLPEADELEAAAIVAAAHLTRYRPTLSHLGVDVGVDGEKRIYLLDFNTIPGKDLLSPDMMRRVAGFTAGFAKYLVGRKTAPQYHS